MGLESLFAWVPELLAWMLGWLPHLGRLHVHEGGVRISGPKVVALSHARRRFWMRWWPRGLYWWVPHFDEVFVDNIKRKIIELPEQLLTTSDSERVRAGGIMAYHISNVASWLIENEDPEHGVQAEAARVLREWVKARTFDEVQEFRPERRGEDDLTRMAQAELGKDFGIRIRQLSLASFARSEATDLHHSGIAMLPSIDDE